jgi:hypothetical protein
VSIEIEYLAKVAGDKEVSSWWIEMSQQCAEEIVAVLAEADNDHNWKNGERDCHLCHAMDRLRTKIRAAMACGRGGWLKQFVIIKPADHGDWKTAAVHPDRWPTLQVGTVVELVDEWINFYGRWLKVRTSSGTLYDIEPHHACAMDTAANAFLAYVGRPTHDKAD